MNYILFNPKANTNTGEKSVELAKEKLKARFGEIEVVSLIDLDKDEFVRSKTNQDNIVLIGGDGTLNRFVNGLQNRDFECNLYFYKAGTGNDFLKDIEKDIDADGLALINDYIKQLPYVIVNEKKYYFVNGVGLGIDGEVCVEVEKRKKEGKKISYAGIAANLAFFKYKMPNATVVVDGVEIAQDKVWMASAMNGEYFGGGLMITPGQDRKSNELTLALIHDASRIFLLLILSSVRKGKHVKYKKCVDLIKAHRIEVTFDRPIALQIDGETILDVTHYVAVKE